VSELEQRRNGPAWADPEFSRCPIDYLARQAVPAPYYDPVNQGWIVTDYETVKHALTSSSYVKDVSNAAPCPYTTRQKEATGQSFIFMDDPDRGRIRRILAPLFTPRRVQQLAPIIEGICSALLDHAPTDRAFNLADAYCRPLSVLTIATILGFDEDRQADLLAWSEDLEREFGPQHPEAQNRSRASHLALVNYLDALLGQQRPPEGTAVAFLAEALLNRSVTYEEALSTLVALLVAGNVSTSDLLSNAVYNLLSHPKQLHAYLKGQVSAAQVIEETLRYDPPLTVVDRIAGLDAPLPFVTPGEWVWPCLSTANRSPQLNDNPDRFNVTRDRVRHLSFGAGSRLCLGAPLARLEAQIGLDMLFRRFPALVLSPSDESVRHDKPSFHGFAKLWVIGQGAG